MQSGENGFLKYFNKNNAEAVLIRSNFFFGDYHSFYANAGVKVIIS